MNHKKRYPLIDQLRGFAIILMVIFHLSYDLTAFGFLNINFQKDIVWLVFPRVIVFLFLFCVGLSLPLSHREKIQWNKMGIRTLKLGGAALIISIYTYITFPKQWVYFGTLHCIAVCSLLALPFLKYPKVSLISAILILGLDLVGFGIPWINLGHRSMDYIPAFPWLSVVLLGIFAHSLNLHSIRTGNIWGSNKLEFLGRYSLLIYLVHQPLLFGTIYLIKLIV